MALEIKNFIVLEHPWLHSNQSVVYNAVSLETVYIIDTSCFKHIKRKNDCHRKGYWYFLPTQKYIFETI